jgi:predicted ATP-grasp superfamily ATP-dependent carboligase
MRSGLAIGRSFAGHNIDFIAAVTDVTHFSCASRYFRHRVVQVADPRSDPDRFVEQILSLAREVDAAAILPITDAAVGSLNAAGNRIPAETILMAPSSEATSAVLDKDENVRIAKQLGIPYPRTIEVDSALELEAAAREIGYPVVLKRRSQQQLIPEEIADFTVEVVHNDAELRHVANRLAAFDVVPQIQEFILGDMHNICCFAAEGKIVAAHEYFSIRRSKHAGIARKIVDVDSTRLNYAKKILGAINWEGVAGVSFLVDKERNQTWYLETNGRFWASVQGSVNAGWDFPYWAYRYFLNGEVPEPPQRSDASKITCYHKDDLAALVSFLRGGPSPVTVGKVSKPMAIWQYLRAFGPGYQSDVFSWSDPLPAIRDHAQLANRYWRGFTRWLGRDKRQ